jgi:hypothetical protein
MFVNLLIYSINNLTIIRQRNNKYFTQVISIIQFCKYNSGFIRKMNFIFDIYMKDWIMDLLNESLEILISICVK